MKNLNIIIFILFLFFPAYSLPIDTLTSSKPLTINQTLVSNGDVFELGFINPANNGDLYIAIWYKNVEPKVYVWVANRDNPITSSNETGVTGVWSSNETETILTIGQDHNIVLLSNEMGVTGVWSSNQSVSVANTVAQLLDDGNFVLRPENNDDPESYIWQSFHYPTDTLLPGMKLGWTREAGVNRFLQSWKWDTDPGSGDYTFKMNIDGFPEFFLYKEGTEIEYRSGPWNGRRFSGVPEMKTVSAIEFEFQNNSDEITYQFELKDRSAFSRLVMESSGKLSRLTWVETTHTWSEFWNAPRDRCDNYRECGTFGVCDANANPVCKCMKGFRPKDQEAWDQRDGQDGCVRTSKLDCGSDGFLALNNMKLPKSSRVFVDKTMSLSECREICKRNCSCTAYANMNITGTGSGCVIWAVDLLDMSEYAESEGSGQDLYVRAAKSDSGSSNNVAKIVAITVGSCAALIILLVLFYFKRKKMQRLKGSQIDKREDDIGLRDTLQEDVLSQESFELPTYEFKQIIAATDNFSFRNKLGEGGFGPVYKGMLDDGQHVAVKRLSGDSGQGIGEFKNEIVLISKLQHRNLVKLLGCCIEGKERLLIYEYMTNKSLDTFLFDPKKRTQLDWATRFNIIQGIGRGLIYLHRDSCLRIIHRDLKCGNVLLDENMNPKISDFGLARTFQMTQELANTRRIVGTYGYMSPEYAMGGVMSEKSDVFSYGVMLLEIMSGKRNTEFIHQEQVYPLAHAWKSWSEGRGIELMDQALTESTCISEGLRCIHVGLLCVQDLAKDRPTIAEAVSMLISETDLPEPKEPLFTLQRLSGTSIGQGPNNMCSVNEVTISKAVGR